jgi:hypothetical protein
MTANGLYMQRCRDLVNHCPTHKPSLKYKLTKQHEPGNDAYTVLAAGLFLTLHFINDI